MSYEVRSNVHHERFADEESPVVGMDSLLRRFFELHDAERWSVDRRDGTHLEGYALEVEAERVLFGLGGPLASDDSIWIDFTDVRAEGLSYWSRREQRWVDFAD